jgi:hypothetical protein
MDDTGKIYVAPDPGGRTLTSESVASYRSGTLRSVEARGGSERIAHAPGGANREPG